MSVLSSNHITPLNEQTKNISKPTTVNLFTQSQSAGASHNNVKSAGQSVESGEKSQIFIDIEFIRILFLFLNILLEKEILR